MKITYLAIGTLSMMLTLTGCFEAKLDPGALGTGTGGSAATDRGVLDPTVTWLGAGNYTDVDLAALPASKVCSDKSIFGATGTAVCASAPSALDVTAAFVSGNYNSIASAPAAGTYRSSVTLFGTVGTMAEPASHASNSTSNSTTVTLTPQLGYWDGSRTVSITDAALLASNIKASSTIFGVAGSASVVDTATGDAVAGEVLSGKKAFVNGSLVTGTATNQGALNLNTTAIPGSSAGFYSSIALTIAASNVCTGTSIFGSAGTAVCNAVFGDVTSSQAYRADNATIDLSNSGQVNARVQAKLSDEIAGNSTFTTNSKLIPDPQYDTDGRYDDTGIGQKRHYLETVKGRPTTVCGLSGTTAQRIASCATQNGTKAVWEASKYGQGGESDWKLVTLYSASYCDNSSYYNSVDCTGNGANWIAAGTTGDTCSSGRSTGCFEVWRDERTLQIWSDSMLDEATLTGPAGNGYNWFKASGYSSNADTSPYTGYQGQAGGGADCYDPGYGQTQPCQPATPISVCADATVIGGTNGVATYQNPDGTNGTTDERPKKGGMTGSTHQWRLPTIEDWNVANANGVRKVLPDMDRAFWSASSVSYGRYYAWYFIGDYGGVYGASRNYPVNAVRCVGR